MKKNTAYYLSLDYSVITYKEEYGGEKYIVAEIPELKGCSAHGKTVEEALKELTEAKKVWIESALKDGEEIPLPDKFEEYSGKLVLRIPPRLHKQAKELSIKEGISLNAWFRKAIEFKLSVKLSNEPKESIHEIELLKIREDIKQDIRQEMISIRKWINELIVERSEFPSVFITNEPNIKYPESQGISWSGWGYGITKALSGVPSDYCRQRKSQLSGLIKPLEQDQGLEDVG